MPESIGENRELICRARDGDGGALGELLALHRDRLRLMIRLRLDQRLQGRIDPSDVLQETYVEALERFNEYTAEPAMPFFLWLRFLTVQRILILHRRHLEAERRDAGREVSINQDALPEASSVMLAAELIANQTTPSGVAMQAEAQIHLQQALQQMDPIDREVLALRHFEQLNRAETARVLGIQESACSKRYVRALKRLKDLLSELPGGLSELAP